MSTERLDCQTCGDACADGVTVVEKDPPGQLIMMCDHTTVSFQLSEYDTENLPPDSELPDEWVREAAAES
ncbi:hypothetical protein AArcSl_0852 [Halalkaliarchaeum desulfuricum]|uniref:Uncharacterized protein n=1 Tax=Halalkaliarchaeum desulfuricum TaxID=2055893 RepID=A0A343THC3_9EURY|nr:hypothetical protein [Halalkaliarchaeum desulfuricum]AUX08495.1 hypothetical protein AArcSl_0852 [Halalkaliarchaeum desulfuricum]